MTQKFLIKFAHSELSNFRLSEFKALETLFDAKLNCDYQDYNDSRPFLILTTDDKDKLYKIVQRSALIKSLFELIDYERDKQKFLKNLKQNEIIKQSTSWKTESFKIQVEAFNKKLTMKEKVDKIEELNFLPFDGEIDLVSPTNIFYLIEYYEFGGTEATEIYFGRYLTDGNRNLIRELALTNRKFISNTSMNAEISLIMANLAQVKDNHICCDLFVGSGSLLIAIAKFGGFCYGIDIDYKLLHGESKPTRVRVKSRDKDENVRANFKQYNIEDKYLDVMIGDSSLPIFKSSLKFDSIVTDPPYSIRESALRIGTKRLNYQIPPEYLNIHTPQKIHYNMHDLIKDLLNFSTNHLVMNGRLVFFYPINKSTYNETDLPTHPAFRIISHNQQALAGLYLRILICMEKIKEPHEIADLKIISEKEFLNLVRNLKKYIINLNKLKI